ncbi:lantibiotic modifying enzyme [Bacillus thermophilus]|uniref:Lantibiotic modifying enzyme n=1 Tax=Siminovitchia thermophila TaxID=1245522 RepID=A0ABS2R7P5_9BACI|nr:lanthionine synthetase C family protein [Siminovitchia thermophila]MBM7715658.1 lantibiotic modifying enzyme [Siminovitchia thermophila]ONK20994.1 hypothetical protein BLX87_24370 [Bacillus sp. VT-16-64]
MVQTELHKSEILRRKVEDIAIELAMKLKDKEAVSAAIQDKENFILHHGVKHYPWEPLSLSHGYPAICVAMGEMDKFRQDSGWDLVGHDYVLGIKKEIERHGIHSLSMWSGLSGILMGVHALSKGGSRYKGFINQLIQFFCETYPAELEKTMAKNDLEMSDYDVIEGWCSTIGILLLYKEEEWAKTALGKVLAYIVSFCEDKTVLGVTVPGWYILPRQLSPESSPMGEFNCGMSHGIAGVLAAMSICLKEGIQISGQKEAMHKISDWLRSHSRKDQYGVRLPSIISWEEEVYKDRSNAEDYHRDAWCYGSPGAARALWLAGEALNRNALKAIALDAYLATFSKPLKKWNIFSPTFCHGLSGLLRLTHLMYEDSGNEALRIERDKLLSMIVDMYDQNAPLGYYDHNFSDNAEKKIANMGMLEGVAGILLTLLSIYQKPISNWDLAFMINKS